MAKKSLKQQCRSHDLSIGHFVVEFVTPGIGYIVANAGCDFMLLDTEHSGFHNETIKQALRYNEAAGLPTIVRVPSKEYHHIARAADMGAEGIMLPMVNDAAEARAILDCMKYAPDGKRGVALGVAHDHYRMGPVMEKLAAANDRMTFFAQIETVEGVENADQLAALDGVDCLWVGHFDLSCSLGIPGQFEHKDFRDAIERVLAACRKHKKAAGRLVPTVEAGVELYRQGFDLICYSGDVWVLQAGIQAGVEGLRAGAEAAPKRQAAARKAAATRTASAPKKAKAPGKRS